MGSRDYNIRQNLLTLDCTYIAIKNLKSLRWWWWEVGTIDSTLVLRLGLDWTGLGLGLDNCWTGRHGEQGDSAQVTFVFSFLSEGADPAVAVSGVDQIRNGTKCPCSIIIHRNGTKYISTHTRCCDWYQSTVVTLLERMLC